MCADCASDYTEADLPENWEEVLKSIQAIYAHHMGRTGGHLHIVLDDFNVEDEHVRFCREDEESKDFFPDDLWELSRACLDLLEPLTADQRGAVISRHWNYL